MAKRLVDSFPMITQHCQKCTQGKTASTLTAEEEGRGVRRKCTQCGRIIHLIDHCWELYPDKKAPKVED